MRKFIKLFVVLLLLIIALFSLGCSNIFKTGYLREDVVIKDRKGSVAGLLYIGSYIKEGYIIGWIGENGMFYREPEKELEYGKIYDTSVLKFTGDAEKGLKKAMIDTNVCMHNLSPELNDVMPESEELYYEYCSTCHAAPDLTKQYNVHMKSVMTSMVFHSNVSDEEAKILNRYINLKIVNQ